jgi:ABC-2 type transport system permease protein
MTSAISYLVSRSAWNRVRRVGADFRRPGPRIAAAAAVAYFILLAWLSPDTRGVSRDHQAAATIGALGMLVLVASAWLLGTGGKLVELSRAERALLLPAPISPGHVMDVKLMRLQATMLGNALLWTALTSGGQDWATLARRALAFWVMLTTLQLHRIAAARMRAAVAVHPAVRRTVGLLGIAMLALVPIVLSGAIRESAPDLTDFLGQLASHPIARAILWPFVLVLRPLTASSTAHWMAQLAPAVALLLLHYLWVRRLGPELERARDPLTSARGAPLWPLAPGGSAVTAFFWKNVTALVRRRAAGVAGAAIVALLALPLLLRAGGRVAASAFLGLLFLMWALLLLLVGPQFARNDLRRDQGMLVMLRTLPVRGYEIILGASGAAALTLATGVAALLLAGAVATSGSDQSLLPTQHRGAWLVAALLVMGPVSFAGILLQNAAVILLPTWSRLTARRGTATALGSNLANSVLTVLLLGVLLLLPAALARGTWDALGGGAVALILGGGVVVAVLGAECWMLVRWLGARFELLDGAPRVRG